ncbi:Transcription factor, fungi [Penicillium expansum]|uniref:Transcription factor, fungi n=1 Tax=Penicillium expansum TaxID=27334 RepID=A0A0A2ID67_PENEN|nr:Transcription factor, fungi [Penicillium expansum]KGO38225.1 Transcription factor, fungi [Penicillium expansum]KGO54580.1 Transcription factor, fungi [Penicillium expansum]KGO70201.1 Transcription factor, fungi [Penicillium expansum]
MTSYFPFFMVPSEATVLTMCKERPFVLVAALAAATSSDKKLQKSLGDKFRTCALHTIVVNNERSLDLLNGMLVYLAWYQFYYIPKQEQFNQLLHIAIGMVGDMGLNLTPAEAMSRKAGLRLTHYRKFSTPSANHDEFFSREARRGYLGCFYLSSITCWITMKPTDLEHPTDALLLPLVQLQNMAEVNHRSLSTVDNTTHDHMNGLDLESKVQSFQVEFKQWKHSLPLVSQQPNGMDLACDVAVMHVYEMGLVNVFATKMRQTKHSSKNSTSSSSTSRIHLEVLFLCLKSAGQLAQNFLSIPTSEYSSLSYIQWSGLIYAIIIIYRLTVGIPQLRDWDVRVARRTIDFNSVLDTLCSRFKSVSICDPNLLENGDLFSMMGSIFENIKQTYERLEQLPQDDSADDTSPVHATSFSPLTLKYRHPCPAFPTWRTGRLG